MAVDNSQFNSEAQQILQELQRLLNKEDAKTILEGGLKEICENFINFYDNYYKEENKIKGKGLVAHRMQLQNLINPEQQSSYGGQRAKESIKTTVSTLANASRKLESLLTGFKTVFLKTLGKEFIQEIVIEDKDLTPIVIKLQGFSAMENFIRNSLSDFQGKLKSNNQMLNFINNKDDHSNLYSKIIVQDSYIKIYQESRRRLNVFYNVIGKGRYYGQALLLYKPDGTWKKFYITTLGDVKEGYIAMVTKQPNLVNEIEKDIGIFTTYIGEVDNTAGTLVQDIQALENTLQISAKSGSAQTGSHEPLIDLIRKVGKGNFEEIRNVFTRDSKQESKQRNRIYNDKESKEKIAKMISDSSKKKAKNASDSVVLDLAKAENILVKLEDSF